jgi:hypothetical protein
MRQIEESCVLTVDIRKSFGFDSIDRKILINKLE